MPAFLDKHIDRFIEAVAEYAPKVIMAIVVLTIGLWLIKRIAMLADKAMQKKDLEVSLRTFLKSLMSIGLKIVLIVTVAGMIGIGTASFVTVLGAAGLAIGLALQGSLSNFAGGVLILVFKPFKVGDTIEAQGQTGEVKEIQIFNTLMLTSDHKTVILPNGVLSNNTIVNNTRAGILRLDIQIYIAFNNNIDEVKAIIMETILSNQMVLKNPAPQILIGKMIDNSISISIKPFCLTKDSSQLTSDLYAELKRSFEKNKIKFPV